MLAQLHLAAYTDASEDHLIGEYTRPWTMSHVPHTGDELELRFSGDVVPLEQVTVHWNPDDDVCTIYAVISGFTDAELITAGFSRMVFDTSHETA